MNASCSACIGESTLLNATWKRAHSKRRALFLRSSPRALGVILLRQSQMEGETARLRRELSSSIERMIAACKQHPKLADEYLTSILILEYILDNATSSLYGVCVLTRALDIAHSILRE